MRLHSLVSSFRPYIALVALLFALAGASPVLAATTATVVEVVQPAYVQSSSGEDKPLEPGLVLGPGRTVSTGAGGHAVIELDDGSTLVLHEETSIELNHVLTHEQEAVSFSLFLGHVSATIRGLSSPDLVVTPTMVIGIRGTEFTVSVADDGASIVSVTEGEVEATSHSLTGASNEAVLMGGQEAWVENAGDTIAPHERRMLSYEDWSRERRARLEAVIPLLPEILPKAQEGIDTLTTRIEELAAEFPAHVQAIQAYEQEIIALGDSRPARRRALRAGIFKETVAIGFKVLRLRVLGAALRTIFIRANRLSHVAPQYQDQLGEEYEGVMAALETILAQKAEVKPRMESLVQEVKTTLEPVKRYLKRLQHAREHGLMNGEHIPQDFPGQGQGRSSQ